MPGVLGKPLQIHVLLAVVVLRPPALSRISSISWPTVLRSGMARTSFPRPLAFHSQDTVQGGSGDPQALSGGDVILHGLVDAVAADHQHMGPAQIVSRHIQPVLVFLGNLVLEEGGQEQNRADGRIPGVVHLAAVGGSVLGVSYWLLLQGAVM